MASAPPSLLDRQIRRVNRRLLLTTFLDRAVWVWNRALALSALWLLVHWTLVLTAVVDQPAPWVYYTVAGAVALAGLVGGTVWAWLHAPNRLTAALSLDEQFGLRERVTTSLTLTSEQRETPAGQALLRDVDQRIEKLDIPGRFPVRLSWSVALVPAWAFVLVLFALLYEPTKSTAKPVAAADPLAQPPVNKAELAQKFNKLKKRPADPAAERPKSENLERIESELDRIANKPRDTREQVRDRLKEITAVEDKIRERQKELAARNQALQQQLQQLDKPAEAGNPKDSQTRDLEKALATGDPSKAQEELDKLVKKLADKDMTDQKKEELKKQLGDLQDKLEKLAQQKDKQEQLEKMHREGKIDAETLKREMDRLNEDKAKLKDLSDLASKLGQLKKAMEEGDQAALQKGMKDASDALRDMDLGEKEMQDLNDQMQRLQDAKGAASKGGKEGKDGDGPGKKSKGGGDKGGKGDKEGDGGKDGDGDKDGDGQGKNGQGAGNNGNGGQGNGQGDSDQPNNGGTGTGRRPLAKDKPFNSFEARQKTTFDNKGQKLFDGYTPGQGYKAKAGPELQGEIHQASQEAPEAIDQQRIPKSARDMAKGYFENLGSQGQKK